MYLKDEPKSPSSADLMGGVLLLPPISPLGIAEALIAACDGCGAQLRIPKGLAAMLDSKNHRTYCPKCLAVRKVI